MVVKDIEKNIKKQLIKRNIVVDRRLFVFLFFVLLSTIFWFLNKLEQEYETDISLPVRYSNFPADKILVNELPDHFDLVVKAHGYKLLEYKISNKFLPYQVNVNSLTLRIYSKSSYVKFFALTRLLKDDIERKLSSELEIVSILPDTLYLDFAEKIRKKVPVYSQMNVVPSKQYMIRGKVSFDPDSITISGANPIVDTILKVFTRKDDLLNLDSPYNDEVKLEKINNVEFSQEKVNASISVEKFTEGSKKIELNIINVPDSIILRTFPNEVTVTYFVALSDYDKVLPQMFEAVVDYNEIIDQKEKLNIKIVNSPDYIQSLRYSPQSVEYIIEKK